MLRNERPCRPTTVKGTTRGKASDQQTTGWRYRLANSEVFVFAGSSPRWSVVIRENGTTDTALVDVGTQHSIRVIADACERLTDIAGSIAVAVDRQLDRLEQATPERRRVRA